MTQYAGTLTNDDILELAHRDSSALVAVHVNIWQTLVKVSRCTTPCHSLTRYLKAAYIKTRHTHS
jgi:hypothetical protein